MKLLDKWVDPALKIASECRGAGVPVPQWALRRVRIWNFFCFWPWEHFNHWRLKKDINRLERDIWGSHDRRE